MDLKQAIVNMIKFEYSCGGYFGGYTGLEIVVEITGTIKVITTHSMKREPISTREMSKAEFEKFKRKLYRYIKDWNLKYTDNDILDGTQWSLEITSSTEHIQFYGSNDFPSNFQSFAKFIKGIK